MNCFEGFNFCTLNLVLISVVKIGLGVVCECCCCRESCVCLLLWRDVVGHFHCTHCDWCLSSCGRGGGRGGDLFDDHCC